VNYGAAPVKLKKPVMTADPSIVLESMLIIVAYDFTVEPTALPMMLLAALKRRLWRGWRAGIISILVNNELPVPAHEELGCRWQ